MRVVVVDGCLSRESIWECVLTCVTGDCKCVLKWRLVFDRAWVRSEDDGMES